MENKESIKQKFSKKIEVINELRMQQLSEFGGSPFNFIEEYMVLEDYLHISLVRRNNSLPLFKLQMNLLEDLMLAENAIKKYKSRIDERQAKIASGDSEQERLKKEIVLIENEIRSHKARCRAIRDIADGIAWRLFDYERPVMIELANRPGNKHINLEGLQPELYKFGDEVEHKKGIAILNDLTHFLKLGDVTVKNKDGTFEFIEVKGGRKTGGRILRQKQGLERAVRFFNTGEKEDEEGRIVMIELDVKPESFLKNVSRLIDEAGEKGVATERIGDHLVVECTDFVKAQEIGLEKCKELMEKKKSWLKEWKEREDLVFPYLSQDKYLNVRNYAPFSIFPLSETARIRLVTGALWLLSFVNLSKVIRYIDERGWRVIKSPEEHIQELAEESSIKESIFVTVRKGPLEVQLSAPYFGRLGFEFLRPRTIVDHLEAFLSIQPIEASKSIVNYTGEPKLWD